MANGEKNYLMGFGLSYAVVALFSAVLVIVKELVDPVFDLLVLPTGHHWGTHGILVIILFLVLGFVFANMDLSGFVKDNDTLNLYIIGSTVIGFLLIFLFFVFHYMGFI